ncbi:MAG: recombinase family protein [Parvibaculaceae bacterium]
MKRIAYLRVSTAEQRPDRQIDGLKGIADELHIEILSAVSRKRPVYEHVIEALAPGDMLVIWDLDRAYRSAKDALNELDALHRRGINFLIANLQIDTTTPAGYLIFTIMSGLAEFERRTLSQRTKEGIQAARARGKRIGRPPKLSAEQLLAARIQIAAGIETPTEIAAQFGVAPWTLSRALRRRATPARSDVLL